MPNNERVTDRSSGGGFAAAYEPRQAAIELGVSEEEVQRLVDAGEIRTIGRYLDTRSYEAYRIRRAVEKGAS